MSTIDQFKAQLIGGGPRANRFRIFLPRAGNKIEFLAKGSQIPAATLGETPVPYKGMILKLAGERTYDDWTVTIINDNEFSARTALEQWQNDIQGHGVSTGMATTDYLLSRGFVEQLGKDDSVLARYEFFNCFPKDIGTIALSYETENALEEFEVTFSYSHWERVI
tara:strand:- start:9 stop:506 length:498 start_codon:yes stop_codon:yes gene_type:complete